ncbi:TetR/AcrR family transcriptional regulator [Tardiphaga sp. 619_E2_N8_5]|uniref:TetR/AcrR family transcriptional regulator n=1 Tax=unclassified Tardiphaga TaxID=2631404 RepID=UPI003F264977
MAKTTTKTHKRPGKLVRQAELLSTVYKVVSEVGIDAASMRQIATRAEVSTGTINYHFTNKENLVMEALRAAYQQALPETNRSRTPLERLKGFAFGYILNEPNDRFWRFWMNYTVYGSRNEELRDHQVYWFKRQQSFWTKLTNEAIKEGELPPDLNPALVAEQLLLFAHGLMLRQILIPDKSSQAHCYKLLDDFFSQIETGSSGTKQKPRSKAAFRSFRLVNGGEKRKPRMKTP